MNDMNQKCEMQNNNVKSDPEVRANLFSFLLIVFP